MPLVKNKKYPKKLITCSACKRHAKQGAKGLCHTCYERKRRGTPLDAPIYSAKESIVRELAVNRPEEVQSEINRRIKIYQRRAAAGKDLFIGFERDRRKS